METPTQPPKQKKRLASPAALLSIKHKFFFVPVGKVANSSIKFALQLLEVGAKEPAVDRGYWRRAARLVHDPYWGPCLRLEQLGNRSPLRRQILRGKAYTRFIFVRNPYTRLLSAYRDRAQAKSVLHNQIVRDLGRKDFSLAEFVAFIARQRTKTKALDQHIRPQVEVTAFEAIDYHFVGKFENLAADWETISCEVFGRTLPLGFHSPKKTSSDLIAVSSAFDRESAELVAEIYKEDFEAFGYSPDSWRA
jgi:hypothetical protein